MSNPFSQDNFDEYFAEKYAVEVACMAIAHLMRQWLQQKTIDAQEFLSIIGNLPVSSSNVFPQQPRKP